MDKENTILKKYSKAEIEDMKSFAKEKLYIEHCLPADIKARSNERIAKLAATVAFIWIGYKAINKTIDRIENLVERKRLLKKRQQTEND